MSERNDSDLGCFIAAWIIAAVLVVAVMYAIVTLTGSHIRETYSPPPVEGTRR